MRILICLLFLLSFGGNFARSGVLDDISAPRVDGATLTAEEVRLVRDFRHTPEPYRRLMRAQVPVSGRREVDRGESVSDSVVGPRDVIDVVISGGQVAFWGKRKDYERVSFRIARGEVKWVSFFRGNSSAETRVQVVFKIDGLHFDVPEAFDGNERHVQGFVVVPESAAWSRGDPFEQTGAVDSSRSVSKASGLQFLVRYASARR